MEFPTKRLCSETWNGHGSHDVPNVRRILDRFPRYLYEVRSASRRSVRVVPLALAFLLVAVAVSAPPGAAEDFGTVGNVNKLINVVASPQLTPGDSGAFDFQLNSTYTSPMFHVRLNVSIYEYATIDTALPVNGSWPYPYPILQDANGSRGREWRWAPTGPVQPRTVTNLSFTVLTSADSTLMPYGSLFNQASYFLRFWLEFDDTANATGVHYRFASKGFFSTAQWDRATNTSNTSPCVAPSCRGNLNLTILGVDGLLPDSAFGVLQPIPRWPFYLLVAFAGFFLVLAFLFWVEENPEAYPRVSAWWARQRGRLTRLRPSRVKKSRKET